MNVLELFSGTHSVGNVCKELNYNVISVDITNYNGKYKPTHKINILEFDYKQYPIGYFNIIWASPPCVSYSILQYGWYGNEKRSKKTGQKYVFTKEHHLKDMNEADRLVKKTFEIIEYFKPYKWFIENPRTGLLKKRDIMKDIPFYDVDYCQYSNWGYRKQTRIWTNIQGFEPKVCNNKCNNMIRNKHKKNVSDFKKLHRYKIPQNLIKDLLTKY